MPKLHVIGGGLAGTEAAWQALSHGFDVDLYEMRPTRMTAAHQTGRLAELVCSNSLKSTSEASAPGQLKTEMRHFGSLVLEAAVHAQVPAGQALAVDRDQFSTYIEASLARNPRFRRIDAEVTRVPSAAEMAETGDCWVAATGPLTSSAFANFLMELDVGHKRLHFYDAIAPILETDSIDMNHAFWGSRYGRDTAAETVADDGDYLNLPLNKEEYYAFIEAVRTAEYMPLHDFEDTKYFEGCLPVEVMVQRGPETLRFGPMKPVGLTDPRTGRWPYANIQLRLENRGRTMVSMVGFQTKMKWPEQKRVFSMVPALREVEFFRYGSVHRNTYLKSPEVLTDDLSFRVSPRLFLAGQITGVEGYTESAAMGILAGRAAVAKMSDTAFVAPPSDTVIGALHNYVTKGGLGEFQPMNANLGLLPPLQRSRGESKADKKARQCQIASSSFAGYFSALPLPASSSWQSHSV